MKKLWIVFCFIALVILPMQAEQLKVSIAAEGVLLINGKTGAILYEKNANKPLFPASTTKISTVLYALTLCRDRLDEKATATQDCIASITPQAKKTSNYRSPPHWLETDGTQIGLKKGEQMRLYDLLYAIMLATANDASNVVAQYLGGSVRKFMEGVNQYLKEIGCTQTNFNNPHGLHHPDHVTTPLDLAIMARKGLQDPLFRKIVATERYICPETNLELPRTFKQTNHLLRKESPYYYPYAIGIKTGTTGAAGKNLVAAAEYEGRLLIAVVMGNRGGRGERFQETIKLFDAAFHEPLMRRTLLPKGEQSLKRMVKGARKQLKTFLPEGLFYDFYPAEDGPVSVSVTWEIPSLPIAAGQKVGMMSVVDERNNHLKQIPLLALEGVSPTFWHKLSSFFHKMEKRDVFFYLAGGAFFFGVLGFQLKKKRRPSRR